MFRSFRRLCRSSGKQPSASLGAPCTRTLSFFPKHSDRQTRRLTIEQPRTMATVDQNDMPLCCPPSFVEPDMAADDSPVVTEIIGLAADVPPGTKKMFEVRDRKILVINDSGKLFAINGLCSHYNYSLEHGIYSKGRIRCPLHGACFNVSTGDIEDYPGFDSLHAFQIKVVGANLVIHTTEKRLCTDRRTRKAVKPSQCNDKPIVVIGSGPSASTFIEHARLNGCPTPITLITDEELPPYDRVLLSKNPSAKGTDIRLRTDDFYKEKNVNIVLNTRVTSIDPRSRVASLSSGEPISYSKLVIATGGTVRKLNVPGHDLENVHYVRVVSEANTIAEKAGGKHIVCIGASFIGMEIASALVASAASVTVISTSAEPLPAFGEDIGGAVRKRFEAKGVRVVCSAKVESLLGSGKVSGVRLADGTEIDADLVIAGIGVVPSTDFLKSSSVKLDKHGFVIVDKLFRTSADWVYAIGDVTTAPLPLWDIESINIQHFQTAQTHGQLLGFSIVGKPHPRPVVPFFWSLFFFEFGVRFAGCSVGHQEVLFRGNLDGMDFVKYYFKDNEVVAVANAGANPVAISFLEMFQRGRKVTKAEVEKNVDDKWEL